MATYRCHVFVLGKMMDIIKLPIITLLVLQLLLVCYSDICNRIISNKFIISIIFSSIALGYTTNSTVNITIPLFSLLMGYIIFHFKLIGGGDVKLITALLLALTAEQSLDFIIYTAIMGGVVMIIGLLINKHDIQQRGVPYAVAITSGFLLSLFT
ncbi:putative tight adherance operon protein [Yersinia intermedia]|jgi:prepilin peptidase CpaA|nr:putative tight adherance operon protein [Yersinia intermedia]CNC64485.1 putative tight adherance operon protein [Yersinia intermedia]CNG39234.1 putative tight adherance operon protein [Yersinia intermedia]CNI01687.1 putative tight adherance operon protein [Yersinia intermedia]CQJ57660.1 putative tight adherance operon protein [Yersinia intermedia]